MPLCWSGSFWVRSVGKLTPRELEIIELAIDELAVGDTADFGVDYDDEIVPLLAKLSELTVWYPKD